MADGKGSVLMCKYKVTDQCIEDRSIEYAAMGCVMHSRRLSLDDHWGYNSARVELFFTQDFKSAEGTITNLLTRQDEFLTLTYVDCTQKI